MSAAALPSLEQLSRNTARGLLVLRMVLQKAFFNMSLDSSAGHQDLDDGHDIRERRR